MPKFTLLAADKLAQEGLDFINSQPDATLLDRPDLVDLKKEKGQEAVDEEVGKLLAAGGVHAMAVRSGIKVTARDARKPRATSRSSPGPASGVDNIDLAAATDKGILVVNTAEASTITTAEHAFTLMMALLRNVGPAYKTMTAGGWDRNKFKGRQLHGMTVGVVGLGRIGRTFADRALAFGMTVLGYDPVRQRRHPDRRPRRQDLPHLRGHDPPRRCHVLPRAQDPRDHRHAQRRHLRPVQRRCLRR